MAVAIEGLRQAVRDLQQLGVDVEDLKDVMADIAREGAEIAAQHAPVASGALRASIRGNRAKGKAVVTAGKARVPYAGPVNYGWPARSISASNFIAKTDAEMDTKAPALFEAGIGELIERLDLA